MSHFTPHTHTGRPHAGNRVTSTFYHPWFREPVFCCVAYRPRGAWWRMCITWWILDLSTSWKIFVPSCDGDFIPRRNTSVNCGQKLSEMWLPWPRRYVTTKFEYCSHHVCWQWNWMQNLHNILHHTAFSSPFLLSCTLPHIIYFHVLWFLDFFISDFLL